MILREGLIFLIFLKFNHSLILLNFYYLIPSQSTEYNPMLDLPDLCNRAAEWPISAYLADLESA